MPKPPKSGRRRKFSGEITYYYHHSAKAPIPTGGGSYRGYRMIARYAARLRDVDGRAIKDDKGSVNYGLSMSKTECREDAARQGKRAVFVDEPCLAPKQKPPTSMERAERRLSEEQLATVREIWANVCAQKAPFRAVAYLAAERVFHEKAVEAVKTFYATVGSFDVKASQAARQRLLAVGAAMEWLRLKAEGVD